VADHIWTLEELSNLLPALPSPSHRIDKKLLLKALREYAISMTNEERKEALLKLEQTYDRLCAQAKDLVYQMSREPAVSARNQFREKLMSIDQQRTNLYAEMDALWKSE
jgi:hypothetical protein